MLATYTSEFNYSSLVHISQFQYVFIRRRNDPRYVDMCLDGESSIHYHGCTTHVAAHGRGQEKDRVRNLFHLRWASNGCHFKGGVHRSGFDLLLDNGSVDKAVDVC